MIGSDWLLVLDESYEAIVGDEAGSFDLTPLTEAEGFDLTTRHEFIEFGSFDPENLGGVIHPNKLGLHCFC